MSAVTKLSETVDVKTISSRIKSLQEQAKSLAKEHIRDFVTLIEELEAMATDISDGGDAYPAGIRDIARQMAERAEGDRKNIESLSARLLPVSS